MSNSYDDLIQQAYAGIGRSGVGEGVNQIDPKGLEYWQGQLQSGALAPQNFQQAFTGAVQGALKQEDTAQTPQYQYIRDFLSNRETPLGSMAPTPPALQQPPSAVSPIPDWMIDKFPQEKLPPINPNLPDKPPIDYGYGYEPWLPGGGGKLFPGFGGDRTPLPDLPQSPGPQNIVNTYGGFDAPAKDVFPPGYFESKGPSPLNQFTDLMNMRGGGFDDLTPQINATQVAPTTYGYINDLYKSVLGRDADEEGLRYWSGKFGESMSPDERAEWMAIAKPGSNVSANSITALGDSTTWGYNMGQQVGANMTNTAQSILSQDLGRDIAINNMGVNGSSLGDAINRGDIEKALGDNSSTVLLNYGMNEAYRGEDPNAFRQQLMDTVQQLKAAGKDVVLQTPNYTEGIKGVGTYADVIRDVAAKTGASLHDKWDETQSLYGQYDPNDPVHPTQQVYQYLGNSLANHLKRKYKG